MDFISFPSTLTDTFQIPFWCEGKSLWLDFFLFFRRFIEILNNYLTFGLAWCLFYGVRWRIGSTHFTNELLDRGKRAFGKRWTSSLVDLNAWRAWSMYRHMSMNIPIELVFTPCIFFFAKINTFPMMSFINYNLFLCFLSGYLEYLMWNVLELFVCLF